MDSHLMTNILNTNLIHSNDKLDQAMRSPDTNQQRSPSHSGESDVDSGIVAIEHNLSRISSAQLPISCDLINGYQLDQTPNVHFDLRTHTNIHPINANNLSASQLNHLNHQIDHQLNHLNENHLINHLINNSINGNYPNSNLINHHLIDNSLNRNHLNLNNHVNNRIFNLLHHSNQSENHFIQSDFIKSNYSLTDHLNDRSETSTDEDSERLRNSCRKVLAKINSSNFTNDAIYANVGSINAELNEKRNFSSNSHLNSAIDALTNCVQQTLQVNETTNQYAVPTLTNCECLNCVQNKRNKLFNPSQQSLSNNASNSASHNLNDNLNDSSIRESVNQQSVEQQSNTVHCASNESTNQERRVNQEDIKRLLLEALRQKNLEKEALEEKERQLNMYLVERQKVLREKELDNRTIHALNKMNLNEDTCDVMNGNLLAHNGAIRNVMTHDRVGQNVINDNRFTHNGQDVVDDQINTSVQYENTTVFKPPQQATSNQYQNVPFPQSISLNNNNPTEPNNNKSNEFTKSCFVRPTAAPEVDNSADELITKSFNGGYCSQQTRKVLEGSNYGVNMKSNLKKPEARSFLQKFSFKFSRAFTKAFFVDKEKVDCDQKVADKQTVEEKPSVEQSLDRTSNFIEKTKSIDTTRSIQETNNRLKIESRVDTLDSNVKLTSGQTSKVNKGRQEKKRFEINLDEYCIVKKPDLTPRKYSLEEEKKRCSIKKRSSMNRKNCLNKSPCTNGLPVKSKTRYHNKTSRRTQSNDDQSTKDDRVSAELLEIYKDGTQVIEIIRKPKRHFGFFLARGKVKQVNGVYVSRMRDEETKRLLTGLLEVGDQIISINGESLGDSSIIEVNYLMTNKTCIKLHVKPYTKS